MWRYVHTADSYSASKHLLELFFFFFIYAAKILYPKGLKAQSDTEEKTRGTV